MEHTPTYDDKVQQCSNSFSRNEISHNNRCVRSSTGKAEMMDSRNREVLLKSMCAGSKPPVAGVSNMSTSTEILSDLQNYMLQNRSKIADPWLHQLLEMMYNFIELEKKSYMSNEEDKIGYKSKKKAGYTFNLPKCQPKKKDAVKRPPNTAFVVNINNDVRKRVSHTHTGTQTELLRDYAKKCVVATKTTQTFIQIYKHKGLQADIVPPPQQPAADHHLVQEEVATDNNNNCLPSSCCNRMNMNTGNHRHVDMPSTSDDWQQYGMLQQRQMSSHLGNEVCWVLENRQKVYGTKFKNVAAPIPTNNAFNHNEDEILEFNKKAQFTMKSSRFNNGRGFESSGQFMSENREHIVNSRSSSSSGHFVNKNSSKRFIQRSNTEQQVMNASAGPFIDDDNHDGQMINTVTGRFIDQKTNGQVMHLSSGRLMDGDMMSSSGSADDFMDDYRPLHQPQHLSTQDMVSGRADDVMDDYRHPHKPQVNQHLASQEQLPLPTTAEQVVEENKKVGGSGSRFFKLRFRRWKRANNT